MELLYVISKHTTANSNYKLHLRNILTGQPWCKSHLRSATVETAEASKPTCKRCLTEYNTLAEISCQRE